jgi:hypothetical protein
MLKISKFGNLGFLEILGEMLNYIKLLVSCYVDGMIKGLIRKIKNSFMKKVGC